MDDGSFVSLDALGSRHQHRSERFFEGKLLGKMREGTGTGRESSDCDGCLTPKEEEWRRKENQDETQTAVQLPGDGEPSSLLRKSHVGQKWPNSSTPAMCCDGLGAAWGRL